MSDDSVRPLQRGLAVLRALAAAREPEQVRAGDLVRATGLARSTVDRVVATLVSLGYVRQQGQELYLAPPLMELGNAYLSTSGLTHEAAARAARLARELDESVSLAVPDRDGVRFTAQATRRRAMSVAFRIGDLLPAERCAAGLVFATGWDEADWARWRERTAADPEGTGFPAVASHPVAEEEFRRGAERALRQGWALDDQLVEPGLVAVAVPVRGDDGAVRGALSAVSHTSRHTAQGLADAVLPTLREEAARLAAADGPVPEARPATRPVTGPVVLQSLARGLAVLRALDGAPPAGLPVTALAEATGLPRTTVYRSLRTLQNEGYVGADGPLFRPLPRVLELGYARLSTPAFADLAQPHLRDLVTRVQESASVTVLDGTDILYVARVPITRVMSVDITLGTRFPAYPTAMGRVLLAGLTEPERKRLLAARAPRALTPCTVTDPERLVRILRQVAADGHAVIDEELEEGLRSVAVPLRNPAGYTVAALNVAQHSGNTPLEATRTALLPALRDTAAAIEADVAIADRFGTVRYP
jgi:IclR family pca regulon transcriptional regulator